jgi:hypothetical protein
MVRHPFSNSMCWASLHNSGKYKAAWAHPSATQSEQQCRRADHVRTVATALSAHGFTGRSRPPSHPPFPPPSATASCDLWKERPSPGATLFLLCPLLPLCHRATIFELPRSSSELLLTALSSAPTLGAPPTSLPVPLAAPPLPHSHSSLADPSHHGQSALALLQPSRPNPKHYATKYILPNRSDPASDPYSGLPPSLPRRWSPPP